MWSVCLKDCIGNQNGDWRVNMASAELKSFLYALLGSFPNTVLLWASFLFLLGLAYFNQGLLLIIPLLPSFPSSMLVTSHSGPKEIFSDYQIQRTDICLPMTNLFFSHPSGVILILTLINHYLKWSCVCVCVGLLSASSPLTTAPRKEGPYLSCSLLYQ
jgi:hypothetical protein